MSVFGLMRMGSSMSVLDFSHFGSTLSLRSISRIGSTFSVFAFTRFGSSLSVLDYVTLGSSLSLGSMKATKISDGTAMTYAAFTTTDIKLYVSDTASSSSAKAMTVTKDGGTLHGAWSAEASVTTSDRRLKTSIEPLYRTLATQLKSRGGGEGSSNLLRRGGDAAGGAAGARQSGEKPVGWLLRELRPVSFHLKRGPEAKYLKFGFIAQELEQTFPNLVRTVGDDQTKAIASQDLIAVLTLALQSLQKELEDSTKEMEAQRLRLERLERVVFASQQQQQQQQPQHQGARPFQV
jgi:hypothetical protein